VYALGTAAAAEGQELKVEDIAAEAAGKDNLLKNPKLAALKARAVELKNKLDNAPGTRATYAELARTYLDIAETSLEAKQRRDAVAAFESGIRMVEKALAASPRSRPDVELLARGLRGLGRTAAQVNRLDEAVVIQLRFIEVADQLSRWVAPFSTRPGPATSSRWSGERTAGWITLGEIFQLRKQPFEAARWYLKGVEAGSDDAARKLARLAQLYPPAIDAAPVDVRAAYRRALQWKGQLKEVPDRFVRELTDARAAAPKREYEALVRQDTARAAELGKQADKYRRLADDYRERGKVDGEIDWLVEEIALREQQAKLVPTNHAFTKAQADTAYRLAGLCGERKRSADAVKWMQRAVDCGHEQAREKVNGVECCKLLRTAGDVKSTEHLVVRYDGVYRLASDGKPLAAPYRVLALPPQGGRSWQEAKN
jgi:tetratricopeptide (TPR) repeat protein